jgi:hypothetical protein
MQGECSKWKECKSFKKLGNCEGCGFKHFENLIKKSGKINDEILEYLKAEYFKLCSEKRQKRGQRVPIDEPIKNLFKKLFPELEEIDVESLKIEVGLPNETKLELPIKCDGAFYFKDKNVYVFYEIKGYGIDINSILSAIASFQLLKMDKKYKNSLCFYIGGAETGKLKRSPYVIWAEANGVLKFYEIINIKEMLDYLKQYLENL